MHSDETETATTHARAASSSGRAGLPEKARQIERAMTTETDTPRPGRPIKRFDVRPGEERQLRTAGRSGYGGVSFQLLGLRPAGPAGDRRLDGGGR